MFNLNCIGNIPSVANSQVKSVHKKMQLDVDVSPSAIIMTFRSGLTHLTFDLDPSDLWPWPMTLDLEHYL